jgi:sugar lactone lactonase YvrE
MISSRTPSTRKSKRIVNKGSRKNPVEQRGGQATPAQTYVYVNLSVSGSTITVASVTNPLVKSVATTAPGTVILNVDPTLTTLQDYTLFAYNGTNWIEIPRTNIDMGGASVTVYGSSPDMLVKKRGASGKQSATEMSIPIPNSVLGNVLQFTNISNGIFGFTPSTSATIGANIYIQLIFQADPTAGILDSTQWSPSVVDGLGLWLNASQPGANTMVPNTLASIQSWTDKSEQGSHATTPTGSAPPVYMNTAYNMPALYFDGTPTNVLTGPIKSSTSYSIFSVVSPDNSAVLPNSNIISLGSTTTPNMLNVSLTAGGLSSLTYTVSTPNVWSAWSVAGTVTLGSNIRTMVCDSKGIMYICDQTNARILKYNTITYELSILAGKFHVEQRMMDGPYGLFFSRVEAANTFICALSPDETTLYVMESGNCVRTVNVATGAITSMTASGESIPINPNWTTIYGLTVVPKSSHNCLIYSVINSQAIVQQQMRIDLPYMQTGISAPKYTNNSQGIVDGPPSIFKMGEMSLAMTSDVYGNIYFIDGNLLRMISPESATITTATVTGFISSGAGNTTTAGTILTLAATATLEIGSPITGRGIANGTVIMGGSGRNYNVNISQLVASTSIAVGKPPIIITIAGDISMMAVVSGTLGSAGYVNGLVGTSRYNRPTFISLSTNPSGYLIICDSGNNAVRTTMNTNATFSNTTGMAVWSKVTTTPPTIYNETELSNPTCAIQDAPTNLYLYVVKGYHCISAASGAYVLGIYGKGVAGYFDGPGKPWLSGNQAANTAQFNSPTTMCEGEQNRGVYYLTDTGNHCIRRFIVKSPMPANGSTLTVAGTGTVSGFVDGPGIETARFNSPYGIVFDPATHDMYVTDSGNHCIRKLTASVVPSSDSTTALKAKWTVSTIAGAAPPTATSGSADGIGTAARFNNPTGITISSKNPLTFLIADTGNNSVRQLVATTGVVTTIARGLNGPTCVAIISGAMYITDTESHVIRKINLTPPIGGNAGSVDGQGKNASLNIPSALSIDKNGIITLVDGAGSIRIITPSQFPPQVSLTASSTSTAGEQPSYTTTTWTVSTPRLFENGVLRTAALNPYSICVDPTGNLYVVDVVGGVSIIKKIMKTDLLNTYAGYSLSSGTAATLTTSPATLLSNSNQKTYAPLMTTTWADSSKICQVVNGGSGNLTAVFNGFVTNTAFTVGGSTGGRLGYSFDSVLWYMSTYTAITRINSIAFNGTLWVAGGNMGSATVAYSYDGINWTTSASGTGILNTNVSTIAWSMNMWVAGGQSNPVGKVMMWSLDGITWTNAPSAATAINNNIQCLACNGSMWLAAGSSPSNRLISSTNGMNWALVTTSGSFTTSNITSLACNQNMWILGSQGSSTFLIAYSTDGITWTEAMSVRNMMTGTLTLIMISRILWNGILWVATAQGATFPIIYSSNGINWTSASGYRGSSPAALGWNGSLWTVADNDNGGVATSVDGITWTMNLQAELLFGHRMTAVSGRITLPYNPANYVTTILVVTSMFFGTITIGMVLNTSIGGSIISNISGTGLTGTYLVNALQNMNRPVTIIGTSNQTAPASAAAPTGTTITTGATRYTLGSYKGYIHEVLVYTKPLSKAMRQIVEGYLAWKWNVALVANHPFATKPPITYTPPAAWPLALSASMPVVWVDGQDPLANESFPPSNGAAISTWYDKSGSKVELTSPVPPTYVGTTGSVSFNGTSYLWSTLPPITSTIVNVFVVYKPSGTKLGSTSVLSLSADSAAAAASTADATASTFIAFNSNSANAATATATATRVSKSASIAGIGTSTPILAYYSSDTTTVNLRVNGIAATSSAANNFAKYNISALGIGLQPTSAGSANMTNAFNGTVSEVIIYSKAITPGYAAAIEGYLAWKWGIALPPLHPYTAAAPFNYSDSPPTAITSVSAPVLNSSMAVFSWSGGAAAHSYTYYIYSGTYVAGVTPPIKPAADNGMKSNSASFKWPVIARGRPLNFLVVATNSAGTVQSIPFPFSLPAPIGTVYTLAGSGGGGFGLGTYNYYTSTGITDTTLFSSINPSLHGCFSLCPSLDGNTIYVTDSYNNRICTVIRKTRSAGVFFEMVSYAGGGQTGNVAWAPPQGISDGTCSTLSVPSTIPGTISVSSLGMSPALLTLTNGISFMCMSPDGTRIYCISKTQGNSILFRVISIQSGISTISTMYGPTMVGNVIPGKGSYVPFLCSVWNSPRNVAISPDGNTLYVCDSGTNSLRAITPLNALESANVYTITVDYPGMSFITVDFNGNLYAATTDRILKITATGVITPLTLSRTITGITGIAISQDANTLYIYETGGINAYRVSFITNLNGLGNTVLTLNTLAGSGGASVGRSPQDGEPGYVTFNNDQISMVLSADGNYLYICERSSAFVRSITLKPQSVLPIYYNRTIPTPTTPVISPSTLTSRTIKITWTGGTNATSYTFTLNGTVATAAYSMTSSSATFTGLIPGTAYTIVITAVNDMGSAASNSISATTSALAATVVAGSGSPGITSGTGTAATFNAPSRVATDATGNMYIADTANHCIRIQYANNINNSVTSYPSINQSQYCAPQMDSFGNIYYVVGLTIMMIPVGTTTAAVIATLPTGYEVWGIHLHTDNGLYFGNRQRPFTVWVARPNTTPPQASAAQWTLTNIVPSNNLSFDTITGVVLDQNDNLYLCSFFTGSIWMIPNKGAGVAVQIGTVGNALTLMFNTSKNLLYVWSNSAGNIVSITVSPPYTRKIALSSADISTLGPGNYAGASWSNYFNTFFVNTNGFQLGYTPELGTFAKVVSPSLPVLRQWTVINSTSDGHVLYYDSSGITRVNMINVLTNPSWQIIAGSLTGQSGYADGSSKSALFSSPKGLCVDPVGNVYVADSGNNVIRRITTAGIVSTIVAAGTFNNPSDIICINTATSVTAIVLYLFVSDTGNNCIRRIDMSTATPTITLFAGQSGTAGYADGTLAQSLLSAPTGLAMLGNTSNGVGAGNAILYVADTGNNCIRVFNANAMLPPLTSTPTPPTPYALTLAGKADTAGTFNAPTGVCVTLDGTVYVADTGNKSVRMITPVFTAGVLTAGRVVTITSTGLTSPSSLTYNSLKNALYVSDTGSHSIIQIA